MAILFAVLIVKSHISGAKQKLICHLCGIKKDLIKKCMIRNKFNKIYGVWYTKTESIISDIFPEANISRLDTDVSQNSKKLNDAAVFIIEILIF